MNKENINKELNWPLAIYKLFEKNDITQIAYVPDAGHKCLINLCVSILAGLKFMEMCC